jgi:hypothetical protein
VTRLPESKNSCGKGKVCRFGKANAEKVARQEAPFAVQKRDFLWSKSAFVSFCSNNPNQLLEQKPIGLKMI